MRISANGNGYNDYSQTNDYLKGVAANSTEQTDKAEQAAENVNKKYGTSSNNKTGTTTQSKEYATYNAIFRSIIKSSQQLRSSFEKLSSTETDSLFEKAIKSGDTKEVVAQVQTFVEQYNAMIKGTNEMGGDANEAFQKEFEKYFSDNKEAFEKLGMTYEKDGTIAVDKAKLEKADVETLQEVFGEASSFAAKVSVKSIYVEANAVACQRENEYSSAYDNYNNYVAQRAKDAPYRNYLR